MATTAITYRTGASARALRTVILDDVRPVVIVAPERMELLTGKLVHGTTCGHEFWGDPDEMAIPRSQVVQVREIRVAVKARHK